MPVSYAMVTLKKIGKSPGGGSKFWRNFDEGRRAGSKAQPRTVPGGTGPCQGTFAGGENPAPKFMQMRGKFQANRALTWRNSAWKSRAIVIIASPHGRTGPLLSQPFHMYEQGLCYNSLST